MRLFYALWPDAAVRRALARWAGACVLSSRGRSIRAENLHATLAFLGEVEQAKVPALLTLAASVPLQGFELVLDELGYWPHNHIVYAGSSKTPCALARLALGLKMHLREAGYRVDARPYVPHVTLVRNARRCPVGVTLDPVPWRVDEVVLVESVREAGSQVYRPIGRFTLVA